MRMRIRLGLAGQQPGQKIAVGKRRFLSEADNDQIQRRDDIKPLLAGADGGIKVRWAAGIDLVTVDGGLEIENGLGQRKRKRAIQPKTHPISGVGFMSDKKG